MVSIKSPEGNWLTNIQTILTWPDQIQKPFNKNDRLLLIKKGECTVKKLLARLIISSMFIATCSTPVYAADRDTGYQAGQTFSWAPYYNSLSVDERVGLFYLRYDIRWDATGASLVNNLLDPPNFWDYYTMECRDTDPGDLGGTTGGYTNLPTGTWQSEDDNGDWLDEEVEYYWANEGLVANYAYSFDPEFVKSHSSGSTYMHLIAQQGPLHQGYDWDFLRERFLSWSSGGGARFLNEDTGTRIESDQNPSVIYSTQIEDNVAKTTIMLNPEEIDIDSIKAKQEAYLDQIGEGSKLPVTITFNPNTSLKSAEQLLNEYLKPEYEGTFKYQALQPDGVIGSGYFRNSSEGYSSFERACAEHALTTVNITGYLGEAKSKEAVQSLMESSIVALADISKPFIENEMKDKYPNKEVRVYVPEQYVTLFPNE